jgi:hypothetical protein
MTTRDFTANVISASKVVPDGNFKDSAASGVWDLNEALDLIKGGNWPNAANFNPASFVDGLFQTHLYDGNGGTQSIVNNIDLSGSGGLVWTKRRDSSSNGDHTLYDTVRGTGTGGRLRSNNNQQAYSPTDAVTAFNNNGFSIGADASINTNGAEYVSWTFRKQPKFFDVVEYSGSGESGQTINHSLGVAPGMVIVKDRSTTGNWYVYHRSLNSGEHLKLNSTAEVSTDSNYEIGKTTASATQFSIDTGSEIDASGNDYIAYFFAHNNDDGGFGESGDQDIIKCGSYTGNGSSTGPSVDLGFEPQFVMIKSATGSESWYVFDNMRGMVIGRDDAELAWNLDSAENGILGTSKAILDLTPTGFNITNNSSTVNTSSHKYIYMAIRRGGMQTPSTPSDVFAITDMSSSTLANTGFAVDMSIDSQTSSSSNFINDRLRGSGVYMNTDGTTAEQTGGSRHFDSNQGVIYTSAFTGINWSWKRARGYFDVVAYSGTGSTTTISHNLGVAPEMMWIKKRSGANNWKTFHSSLGATKSMELNTTVEGETNGSALFNSTAPTASVFTVGSAGDVNSSSHTYIAYLFATVAGVSKVGSFTATGSDVNVDCGFTNGAKFVLIKRTNTADDWFIFRDIASGNDKRLKLNTTDAEATGSDNIDPLSSGFTMTSGILGDSGNEFIFYAIANDPS